MAATLARIPSIAEWEQFQNVNEFLQSFNDHEEKENFDTLPFHAMWDMDFENSLGLDDHPGCSLDTLPSPFDLDPLDPVEPTSPRTPRECSQMPVISRAPKRRTSCQNECSEHKRTRVETSVPPVGTDDEDANIKHTSVKTAVKSAMRSLSQYFDKYLSNSPSSTRDEPGNESYIKDAKLAAVPRFQAAFEHSKRKHRSKNGLPWEVDQKFITMSVAVYALRFVEGNGPDLVKSATEFDTVKGMNKVTNLFKLERQTVRRHLKWHLGAKSKGSGSKNKFVYLPKTFEQSKIKGLYFDSEEAHR